ncbi:MAG TPA: DNA topoisomerase III [Candidatus Paceibacterota bacterium]|nr:DNA topoisomerase III [Verrucomicrobiota bacterium]HRY50278.1 DNA topoisomerase III [Candidatus Paceibacterota bacterium]
MGKALIIAEKPSVAADIARALGGFARKDDYFESDHYVLSSAIGHLLEICPPEGVEVKRGKWTFAHLPVIPPHFDLRPIEKTESRLKLLVRLIKRKDIDHVVNACDAGREGELIFRHIITYAKIPKTIHRLWLQSMTPAAIRDGFSILRDEASMRPLADAATCRSEADWLVGINGTRAMTAFNSKLGGFQLTTVGRVQTPTLTIVVEREEKIKRFVPRDYWEVHATFEAASGDYVGRWIDEGFSREKNGETELRPERIWDPARAEAIQQKCLGKPGDVTEESKPTTQLSPLLFDLTSLQREANGRFGFSAKRTLQIAQALYEKHKVLTYPRTDSRALPEDYIGTVHQSLGMLQNTSFGEFAQTILAQGWVRPNKRIFNNAKISDHFAIIPTTQAPKHLNEEETKLYDLVTRRFLAVFYPAAEFLTTVRITRVAGEPFKSDGKVMVNPGWLVVYGRDVQADDTPTLTPVQSGEQVLTREMHIVATQTKPPARFTEATLLSAMEGAGKLIEDEELREAMSAKGLGTPATRAQIIEGLITEKYLHRHGRELQPTAKAFSLITLLRGIGVDELCRPELTGNWEFQLKQMERGQLARPDFMREIAEMTRGIVAKARNYEHDTVPGDFGPLKAPCPKCGGVIQENYKKFQCQSCEFALWKILAGRQFEPDEMEELLARRTVGPLQGFRSKLGRPFAAIIKLTPECKLEFDFGQNEQPANGVTEPVDFTGKESLGNCPQCGSAVFENGLSYVCEKAAASPRTCSFRSGKIILQQTVDANQMKKLLQTGRTDLLHRFVSKKGRRFSAYLVVGKEKKVGFEFANSKNSVKTVQKPPSNSGAELATDDPANNTHQT